MVPELPVCCNICLHSLIYLKKSLLSTSIHTMLTKLLTFSLVIFNIYYVIPVDANFKSEFTYQLEDGFPLGKDFFGQVVGIDIDKNNNVILFHRGSHEWSIDTFDNNDIYSQDRRSPIKEPTVITIDFQQNKWISSWGNDLFYMPHGLTISHQGDHVWLTDVALHQVFKFTIDGSKQKLALGTRFEPGNDDTHFCKPTSVADTGRFIFIADGYCNSRIVMFTSTGKYIGQFGEPTSRYLPISARPQFNIPHKIVYNEDAKLLCVADRENGRIQCFHFEPGNSRDPNLDHNVDDTGLLLDKSIKDPFTITNEEFNGKMFSIDYSPVRGGILVAVSGRSNRGEPPIGFVYNMTTLQLLSRFSPPSNQKFGMAHDVAISNGPGKFIYVADADPANLWRFYRTLPSIPKNPILLTINNGSKSSGLNETKLISDKSTIVVENPNALISKSIKDKRLGYITIVFLISIFACAIILITKKKFRTMRKRDGNYRPLATLYNNTYPSSINSLFANNRSDNARQLYLSNGGLALANGQATTMFSRRAFFNLFKKRRQNNNDFSRIPFEDSDHSGDEHSDSDIEEFNINKTNPESINIEV